MEVSSKELCEFRDRRRRRRTRQCSNKQVCKRDEKKTFVWWWNELKRSRRSQYTYIIMRRTIWCEHNKPFFQQLHVIINRLFVLSLDLCRWTAYIRTTPNPRAILNPVPVTRSGIYTRPRSIDSPLPLSGITSCIRLGTFQTQPVTSRRLSCYPSTLGSLAVRSATSRPKYRPRWYPVSTPPLVACHSQSSYFSS